MDDVFYWLFNTSIIATLVGLIVMLIGKVKRIPRRVIFILWTLPFLRLWIPFGIGSKYSLVNLLEKFGTKTVVWEPWSFDGAFFRQQVYSTNVAGTATKYFPIEYKTNLLEDIFEIASIVWVTVAVIILTGVLISYIISMVQYQKAEHLRDNIYLFDKLDTPIVHGLFRQKIILPTEYKEKDLTFILAHENAHIKRRDNICRAVGLITASVHWFNPFVWLFLKQFFTDMELSCDERVLKKLGEDKAKEYATALVDEAESKMVTSSAFGGAKIRGRIDNIFLYKKLSAFSLICFTALVSIIAYVLLTNAV